jgi:hypothetical protein
VTSAAAQAGGRGFGPGPAWAPAAPTLEAIRRSRSGFLTKGSGGLSNWERWLGSSAFQSGEGS